jgi:hypothetical protein
MRVACTRRDDIGADVVRNRKLDLGHPVKIAAGQIEHGADVEIGDQAGQGLSHLFGIVQRGTTARHGLLITPDVAAIDFGKNLARGALQVAHHQGPQPDQDRGGQCLAGKIDTGREKGGAAQSVQRLVEHARYRKV